MNKPRIQTTGSYCPNDNVFSIAICPVADGPTFTFDMLTRADLDEIESLVSCLKDSHDYPEIPIWEPRKGKRGRRSKGELLAPYLKKAVNGWEGNANSLARYLHVSWPTAKKMLDQRPLAIP